MKRPWTPETKARSEHQWSDGVVATVLLLLSLALVPLVARVSAYFANEIWCLFDDTAIAYAGYRASLGEYPHIGYQYLYAGGLEILLGWTFSLFGTSLGVAQWLLGLCMACSVAASYLLYSSAGLDRVTAVASSTLMVLIGYTLNFHIFPAWFAQALVIVGILLASYALVNEKLGYLVAAGSCAGLASSLKQTVGVYSLLGFVLAVILILAASGSAQEQTTKQAGRVSAFVRIRFALLLIVPLVVAAFLLYVTRTRLTPQVFVMFLSVPMIVAATTVGMVWVRVRRKPSDLYPMVRRAERALVWLAVGFLLGFLPIVLFYATEGGLSQFASDTFIRVESEISRRFAEFDFASERLRDKPLVMLRGLVVFVSPLISVLLGVALGMRSVMHGQRRATVIVVSASVLAILYMTLFPNPNRVHVLFALPLIALAYVYGLDLLLKRVLPKSSSRAVGVLAILFVPIVLYLAARVAVGDVQKLVSDEIGVLDDDRGNIYVPLVTKDRLLPVLRYLKTRPPSESFLAFDPYNKALAFLADRPLEVDYKQRHQYREVDDADVRMTLAIVRARKVDTVVMGLETLKGTETEQELQTYLQDHYTLELTTTQYLVYQRVSGRQ